MIDKLVRGIVSAGTAHGRQNLKKSGGGVFRSFHRPAKRAAAIALSVCMVITAAPTGVFAANSETETGLCENHPAHTAGCGYREAKPGHLCEHEHTEDCYTDEVICGYIVDEDATASDSDAQHHHTQECYALDCPHENGEHKVNGGGADKEGGLGHDGDCGYIEAVEGIPCSHVCELCGESVGSGNPGNGTKAVTLVAFEGLDEGTGHQTVPAGTPLEDLVLPKTLSATAQTGEDESEPVVIQGVIWEPDVLYEGAAGSYDFTASAAGYTCAQGVDWPVITVTVEKAIPEPDEIDALCAAIDGLPTVDELYANAPGDQDPEYDAWVAETSRTLAEVSGLWKQLSALLEDAEAMERITGARVDKLAALNNLAERLGEMEPKADTITPTVGQGTNIFANGAEIKVVAGETEEYTNILYDKDGNRTIEDTEYLKIGNDEPTAGGYDLSLYSIYGGGSNTNVDGVTRITMTGGRVYDIYGGGKASISDADVKGTELNLSGGLVRRYVCGGGNAFGSGKTASVTGDTNITLSDSVVVGVMVLGGGYASGSNTTATVEGKADVTMTGGTVGNYDMNGQGIYGGGLANRGSISIVTSASVEMTGGTAVALYGGGRAGNDSQSDVTGAVSVSLSGNAEVSDRVYGGGYTENSGTTSTVSGTTVTVGGGVKIGGDTAGIVIDGGTASVANGVDSFVVDNDLTEGASVNVQIPEGYDITSNPTIATGAVEADLAKIKLVGDGAEGKEAYFEGGAIKVREKAVQHIHAMSVDCSTTEGEQVTFDKALTSQNGALYIDGVAANNILGYYDIPNGNYYLAADMELDGGLLMQDNSAPTVNLCLNGHKLAYTGNVNGVNVIQSIAGTLNLCDCDGSSGSHSITSPVTNESVTISGGLVTGGTYSGIYIANSTCVFHLYGGTIAGNGNDKAYGGVYNSGSLTMHGGSIVHNRGGYGGVYSFGSLTIAGGKISNNRAKGRGGGVYVDNSSNSSLTFSGTPVISDNTAREEPAVNNLELADQSLITVGNTFDPDIPIGITTRETPAKNRPVVISGQNSKDYSGCFKSDNDAYVIQNGANNVLQLRVKSDDATLSALTYKVGNDGGVTEVPSFTAETESYNVTLPYDTAQDAVVTLTGTLKDSNAAITTNEGVTLSGGSGTATITVKAEDGTTTRTYTVVFTTGTRSDARQITAFTISGQVGGTVIDQNNHTITVTMPNGTDVTNLTPTITVSDKATVSPQSNVAQDFTNSVTYTVTAENESTQEYTVTVNVLHTHCVCGGSVATGGHTSHSDVTWTAWTSDNSLPDTAGSYYLTKNVALTTAWTVPAGTVNLCLNGKTVTGFVIKESTGSSLYTCVDIPADATLTVCDHEGSGSMNFNGNYNNNSVSSGIYGGTDSAFTLYGGAVSTTKSAAGNVCALYNNGGTFDVHGGTVCATHNSTGAYMNPFAHGVITNAGTTTLWGGGFTAKVTNSMPYSDRYSGAYGARVMNTETETGNLRLAGAPTFTFSNSTNTKNQAAIQAYSEQLYAHAESTPYSGDIVSIEVLLDIARDGGVVVREVEESNRDKFSVTNPATGFTFTEITEGGKTHLALTGPYQVKFDANGGTGSMTNQSFTSYTDSKALTENAFTREDQSFTGWNTAQNGTGKAYADKAEVSKLAYGGTVTLYAQWGDSRSDARQITAFTISGQVGETAIDQINHTITVTMPNGTDVTSLTPTITVSDKASVSPTSGEAQDFTNPVIYTVTAENEITQDYRVSIAVQAPGNPTVTGVTVAPASVYVQKGGTQRFTATVTGTNSPAQTVTWSMETSTGASSISEDGVLTVGSNESQGMLRVKATSTADTSKSGIATVYVTDPEPGTTHTITASAGSGGTISPTGAVTVNEGEPQTFTINSARNYAISQVIVDGENKGTAATYTFENVTEDHSISVTFRYIGGSSGNGGGGGGGNNGNASTTGAGSTTPNTTTITTVTTDNVQTIAGEGVSNVIIRPDASAINSAAMAAGTPGTAGTAGTTGTTGTAGAAAGTPASVLVNIPQDVIAGELAKPEIGAVAVEVILPATAPGRQNAAGVAIAKETIQAAKDTGKNVSVTVRKEDGSLEAVWSLDGAAMRNAGSEAADVGLILHTTPVQSEDPSAQAVKPLAAAYGNENGLVLDISGTGRLTAPAKLTVPATGQTGMKPGDQVALYRHDPATGALVAVPGGNYIIDANGNVTIDLPAKDFAGGPDRYVLLPVLAAGAVPPAAVAPAGATTPYEIKRGDTLNKIARQHGCTVQELLDLNQIPDVTDLRIGQVIQLPVR